MKFVIAALVILPIIMMALSVAVAVRKHNRGASSKKAFKSHLAVVGALVVMMAMLTIGASAAGTDKNTTGEANAPASVSQQEDGTQAASDSGLEKGLGYIAAALSIGLAGIGAGLSIAAGAPAAIGATSENPKMFGKGMIFCVLGEAIAIYGLVISFMILMV